MCINLRHVEYEFSCREEFEPRMIKEDIPRKHWRTASIKAEKPPKAEDVFAIETLMSKWTEYLKVGHLKEYILNYMSSEKEELFFWLGEDEQDIKKGYNRVMEDCLRMDSTYKNNRYKTPIIHSAMAPLIEIS